MAIEKFEKNMAIVSGLDDEPNDAGGLSAAELKAKFDEGGEALKEYINNTLIPGIAQAISEAAVEGIPDGSIPQAKLETAVSAAIDRAKEGGALDQSLANKAPAGFGSYGEVLEMSHTSTDAELFSALDAKLARLPNGSAMRIALTSNETLGGYQYDGTLEKFSDTLAVFKGITYGVYPSGSAIREPREVVISKTNANWIIEYVNPPMELGIEYRTTERYNGKPVYAQLYQYPGTVVIGYNEVAHGIEGIEHVVRVFTMQESANGKYAPFSAFSKEFVGSNSTFLIEASYAYLAFNSRVNGRTVRCAFYYTKEE